MEDVKCVVMEKYEFQKRNMPLLWALQEFLDYQVPRSRKKISNFNQIIIYIQKTFNSGLGGNSRAQSHLEE